MKALVTGSAGHLGEALVRTLREAGHEVIALDRMPSPFTTVVGSITDPICVRQCMAGVQTVYHAATLHKPHVVTHTMRDFIDTNITGTLTLLEEAASAGIRSFIFTSTTSVFGSALTPPEGEPAAWITEDVQPIPKNIYGVTKLAAEDFCHLFHRKKGLACIILRTSRFFPEEDDNPETRARYTNDNAKTNELLFRRVDLDDVVSAHLLAARRAPEIGFGRYIVSATTPFRPEDLPELRGKAEQIVEKRAPDYRQIYHRLGWSLYPGIDRVYVNEAASRDLDWRPKYDFAHALRCLEAGNHPGSALARVVGSKGYHAEAFTDGPYPVQ